jgi:hypothetical protein
VLGAALLLLAGFTIGIQGWSVGWMKAALPALPQGQFGLGWGGIIVLLALLMIFAHRTRQARLLPRRRLHRVRGRSAARRCCCCSSRSRFRRH